MTKTTLEHWEGLPLKAMAGAGIWIYCELISGYPATLATFVSGKKLDMVGKLDRYAQDFVVFSLEHLVRYTGKGMAVYSVVERNRCAVVPCAATLGDFPCLLVACHSQ